MEKFNTEIVSLITESFFDDIELTKDTLLYLYKTTNDDDMKQSILRWFNTNDYCIQCGAEMEYYEVEEYHSEVDAYETIGCMDCPCCGDRER